VNILSMCKVGNKYADEALEYLAKNCEVDVIKSDRNIYLDNLKWRYDYIISFLYPHVINKDVLCRAEKGAINFHPGSPDYPGIGCTNFAIYNGADKFGVTCHYMNEQPDTGDIIDVRYFMMNNETVLSLTNKCYAYMLAQFYDMIDIILQGKDLPIFPEKWTRKPYIRRELNELCVITSYMDKDEVSRRILATEYPSKPGAYINIHGERFEYNRRIKV